MATIKETPTLYVTVPAGYPTVSNRRRKSKENFCFEGCIYLHRETSSVLYSNDLFLQERQQPFNYSQQLIQTNLLSPTTAAAMANKFEKEEKVSRLSNACIYAA